MGEQASGDAPVRRTRRDPRTRRRAIVEAAAALIVEGGGTGLTHRRVAARARVPLGATTYYFASLGELRTEALRHLADQLEEELAGLRREVADTGDDPAALAGKLHAYLSDRTRVRTDTALYFAGARSPELRPLALRWFNGLVETLSPHTGPDAARAVAVFVDGATVHAVLHDEPLGRTDLTRALTALLRPRTPGGAERGRG